MLKIAAALAALLPAAAWAQAPAGPTLASVRSRGVLQCSASVGTPGFGMFDRQGIFQGLDADTCRAVAAVVFGDATKVKFNVLNGAQRVTALQTGQVDVTIETLTWSQSREASAGLQFTTENFYDGQSFLVRKSSNITDANQLAGAAICVVSGSTSELNLQDWARHNKIDYRPVVYAAQDETRTAYENGRCDAITTDSSQLAAIRSILTHPEDSTVLGIRISKEPLGPAVRKGDDQWFDIVRWTVFALINAEELGITQANVDAMTQSDIPAVRRLLGTEGDYGHFMGVDNKWAYNAIKAVGNYGEIYNRHFGPGTQIDLPRKINNLWDQGGIMYAPPVR